MAARETAIPGRTPCSTHPSTGKQSPPQRAPPAPPTPRHVTPRSAGLVRVDKSKSLSHPRRIHPVTKATYPPEAPAIAAHCAKPPWPPPNRTSTTAPHGARPMSTSGLRCLPRHRRHPPRRAHPPLTRPPSRHLRARRQGPRLLPAEPVHLKCSTTCTASATPKLSCGQRRRTETVVCAGEVRRHAPLAGAGRWSQTGPALGSADTINRQVVSID